MSKGFLAPTRDEALKLRVAAPPADGKANAETERFLAKLLGIPRSDVAVIRGASSRDKAVLARGLGQTEAQKILSSHLR